MKKILGKYFVRDCEHWGDMDSAELFLKSLGVSVTGRYWDGRDCGEAWVSFEFPSVMFVSLYRKLSGSSVSYSENINDYIIRDGVKDGMDGYGMYSASDLRSMMKLMASDLSSGFEERLPLWLFFEVRDDMKGSVGCMLGEILSYFTEPVEVMGYYYQMVDDTDYVNVLIKSSWKNLVSSVMNGIGDYCLSNKKCSWFGSHHIYGECRCVHDAVSKMLLDCGSDYEYIQRFFRCMLNRLPIEYEYAPSYYNRFRRVFEFNEYVDVDGGFRYVINDVENKEYKVLDLRKWKWSDSVYNEVVEESRRVSKMC